MRTDRAEIDFPMLGGALGEPFSQFEFDNYVAPPAKDKESCIAVCDGLIDILSALFNVSGRQLRSPKRSGRTIDRTRQLGMYLAHVSLGLSMTMVAEGFSRAKSTVVHACRQIEDMRDDADFDRLVARLELIIHIAFGSRKRDLL